MLRSLLVAAVLLPGIAHAEFAAKKTTTELRAATKPRETLTVNGMLDKINGEYLVGLQRCYSKGLAENPSLRGRITLTFTVNPYGHVSGTITGTTPKTDACLTAQVGKWRFPTPRDPKKGTPTEASFRLDMFLTQ